MPQTTLDETQIKALFKEALVEVLEERKDLLRELIEEIIEDLGMGMAIREGENTEPASREEVFHALEGGS